MQVPSRYIKTRADSLAVEQGCYWDQQAGDKVVEFFRRCLTLSSGPKAGQPFDLYDLQLEELIFPLYCWRRDNGNRRFSKCLVTSGKKNFGKSAIAAGLALYHLLEDGEMSPKCILAGATREQASELFKEVSFSIENNDELEQRTKVRQSIYYLTSPENNGELKAVSAEASGKGGWNCSLVVLEECALHQNDKLYQMLRPSMKAREQPMFLLLSNAGYDKTHWYHTEVYKPAKAILSGESDQTNYLPVIFEVPEEADWKDPNNWHLANPGVKHGIVKQETLIEEFKECCQSKASEMSFRRFTCNQFTSKRDAWLDLDEWDKCKGIFPPLVGQDVYLACDLSATTDLTSIAAVYPINGKFYVKSYNFVPRAAVERREKQNLRDYSQFAYEGFLNIIDGNAIDYDLVLKCVKSIPGNVKVVVFDKWNALSVSQQLQRDGYQVLNFPQSASYFNEPTKKVETLVADRKLVHDGNSCLRWCINNVQLQTDNKGLVRPTKASEATKIDAAVAMLMALSQAILHDYAPTVKKSVYDTRRILSV